MPLNLPNDIYASWRGITKADEAAQQKGLSSDESSALVLPMGDDWMPYATHFLFAEAVDSMSRIAIIPAAKMRSRLEQALQIARSEFQTFHRERLEQMERILKTYRNFVSFCEKKERETGEPVLIIASSPDC